jgi:dTDP-D-glucose 4,6-dehydratase
LRYVSNITRVSKDLGWRPWISVEDGLRTIL